MTYRRFEELPVWNAAIELAARIYALGQCGQLARFTGLRNQIERAVLSISNNIAEGFERGTMAELISFLYIARGSAGEVRSMVLLMERLDPAARDELSDLRLQTADVSRQLGAWIVSLENSPIKGSRSLTDQEKSGRETAKRRDQFLHQLRQVQSGRTAPPEGPKSVH